MYTLLFTSRMKRDLKLMKKRGKDISKLETNKCVGILDVNGVTFPNKEVTCSSTEDGATKKISAGVKTACEVKKDNHLTDIFPIVVHDGTAEPATNAAMGVFTSK